MICNVFNIYRRKKLTGNFLLDFFLGSESLFLLDFVHSKAKFLQEILLCYKHVFTSWKYIKRYSIERRDAASVTVVV